MKVPEWEVVDNLEDKSDLSPLELFVWDNEPAAGPWRAQLQGLIDWLLPIRVPVPVCSWSGYFETDQWGTDCGRAFSLIAGNPAENGYTFCPGCGRRIEDASKFEEIDE